MIDESANFKRLLDSQYTWPADYIFKFIVPSDQFEILKVKLGESFEFKTNSSKTGKYISLSAKKNLNSSNEVIEIYSKVKEINGLISL